MRVMVVVSVVVLTAVACGGANQSSQSAGSAASQGAGAGQPGPPSGVTVVPCERLRDLLPELPGWTRNEPKCETDTTESVSRVQADYEMGMAGLSFEIMDSSMRAPVLTPINEMLKAGDTPHPGGYTKITTVKGSPAAEEWTEEPRNGAIHILVANRFMVVVTGSTVPGVDTIRQGADALDLQKLAGLK